MRSFTLPSWLAATYLLFLLPGCGESDTASSTPSVGATSFALEAEPTETAVWEQKSPSTAPSASWGHSLVYDSARGRVVLFGGSDHAYANATWEWDGGNWTQMSPSSSPSARDEIGLAYDSARGKVVLFGGMAGGTNILDDTWEWDGENWLEKSPTTKPPARRAHALAYDSARKRVVLFGGTARLSNLLDDTWEWDGENWLEKSPTTKPPARIYIALAYDSARGKTVLFGGRSSSGERFNDTWEWDGENWIDVTPVDPAARPPVRDGHALAYDSARGKTVLFGGGTGTVTYRNDTWEWDGENWRDLAPATMPPGRSYTALAYDSTRGRAVLFGGGDRPMLGDTWEFHTYGGACSSDAECNSGFCVDGVCCETACEGGCQVCSVAKGAETDGICSPVADDTVCDDGSACTASDSCQAGVCTGLPITCPAPDACEEAVGCDAIQGCVYELKLAGTECRASVCEDGEEISGKCDGVSAECAESTPIECGLYVCGGPACLTSCASDDDCVVEATCVGSTCVIEEVDAGADGGDDETDAGPTEAGNENAEAGAGYDGSVPSEGDAGEVDPVEEADESGCSCRAAGGSASHGHAAWLGLGLAVTVWRRSKPSSRRARTKAR